jgi:FkbM family methyltransferase
VVKELVTWPPVNHPLTASARAVLPGSWTQRPSVGRYLPRSGLVEARLPDGKLFRMWSRGDDDIATTLFWRNWAGHEPETAVPFYERASSARTTLDIGAHVGYFALLAALANPRGQVLAFEPLGPVRSRLARNVALNDVPNLSCLGLALGNRSGRADFFHVPAGIPSSSSLSGEFLRTIISPERLVRSEVEVATVDEFVTDRGLAGRVDLVKIDTEDTEDQVLEGMTRTLALDRPTIFCEVLKDRTGRAIEAILERFGYRYFLLASDGPRSCEHVRPHSRWRNFLFLPGERAGGPHDDPPRLHRVAR